MRAAVRRRAQQFCEATGNSLSSLGRMIGRDSTLVVNIVKGKNFTVGKYTKIMRFIDEHLPDESRQSGGTSDDMPAL